MNNRKSILCLFLLFLLSLGSLSVNAQTVSKVFKEQSYDKKVEYGKT